MRFAYIDSQGNEVSIPSVDALALRIELGAIGPETQLYDEQADHWAPANTHEIFHTLSRAQDDDGFVAPPPVAPPPSLSVEPEEAPEAPAEEPGALSPDALSPDTEAAEADDDGPPSVFDLGDGIEFEQGPEEEEPEVAAAPSDDLGLGLDLAPATGSEPAAEPAPEPASEEGKADAADQPSEVGADDE